MASRETRIKRVARALFPLAYLHGLDASTTRQVAKTAIDAAGPPDLVGAAEFADLLGVLNSNLRRVSGLPKPIAMLKVGPVWDAEEAKAFARERERNPPSRWNNTTKKRRG